MRGNHPSSFSDSALLLCAALLLAIFCNSPAPAAVDGHRLFSAGLAVHHGIYLSTLSTADMNNDGFPDLVLSDADQFSGPNHIAVLLGRGDGTFETVLTPIDMFAQQLTVADMNGDGFQDVVWTGYPNYGMFVCISHGQGDGTLHPPLVIEPEYGTNDSVIRTADLDADGDQDIIYQNSNLLMVLRNDGEDIFTELSTETGHSTVTSLDVADFDGDGIPDAAAATLWVDPLGRYNGKLLVMKGLGDCSFDVPTAYGEYYSGRFYVAAGDANGDGHLDLICTDYYDTYFDNFGVEIWHGLGDGTFGDRVWLSTVYNPRHIITAEEASSGRTVFAIVGDHQTKFFMGSESGVYLSHTRLWFTEEGDSSVLTDFDGDGDLDAAVCTEQMVTVYLGYGEALFAAERATPEHLNPLDAARADWNGDGVPDLGVAAEDGEAGFPGDGDLFALLGLGDGSFTDPLVNQLGYPFTAVIAAELTGDGVLDMAGVSEQADRLAILPGNGDGTFGPPLDLATGEAPLGLAAAQLFGDANLDLVTADNLADSVSIFAGLGGGAFAPPITFSAGSSPSTPVPADLDFDGDLDLVVGQRGGGFTVVLLNNGDDTFADPVQYASGNGPRDVCVADMTFDGYPDLVVANNVDQTVALLPGLGDGTFGEATAIPISHAPESITAADLDGNGTIDLALTTQQGLTFIPGNGVLGVGQPVDYCSVPLRSILIEDFDGDGGADLAAAYPDGRTICLVNGFGNAGLLATGPGPGEDNPPLVRVFHPGLPGSWTAQWQAYGVSRYGVNTALGNVDGGLGLEVVTGAGPGAVFGPHVRGFSADGTPLPGFSFLAYGTNRWGVNVACGDIDGDGFDEVLTGAGPGDVFGPHVRGWNRDMTSTVQPLAGVSFLAYGTNKYGVNVSCGDIDGDGFDEIVTGPGPGAVFGPHVRGWDYDGSGTTQPLPDVSFLAYGTSKYGVNVACGDIDGDGIDEIVTGPGPGIMFTSHVRGWNWDGTGAAEAIGGVNFIAWSPAFWGVNVACGDLDGNGIDEIVTGRGPGPNAPAMVRCWNYDGLIVSNLPEMELLAYDPGLFSHGVRVAAARR